MKKTPCKGCGKPIVWGTDPNGKHIPLDPKPPIYRVVDAANGARCYREPEAMVSHFATCMKANMFSGSNNQGGS